MFISNNLPQEKKEVKKLVIACILILLIGPNACRTYELIHFKPSEPDIDVYYSPFDLAIVGDYRTDRHTVAEVIRGKSGELIIVVNTFYMQTLPPLLQEFVLRHEEGHIILGFDPDWKFTKAERLEEAASCYAFIFFNDVEKKLIKKMAQEHHLKEGIVDCWE